MIYLHLVPPPDGQRPGGAAGPEGAGGQAPGGGVSRAPELRGEVQRAHVLPAKVPGEEPRAGGDQDEAAGRATQQQVPGVTAASVTCGQSSVRMFSKPELPASVLFIQHLLQARGERGEEGVDGAHREDEGGAGEPGGPTGGGEEEIR